MTQSRRGCSFVAVIAAALLVLAIPAGAVPAKQWRTQADAICAKGNQLANQAQQQTIANANPATLTPAQLDALAAAVAPILGQEHDAIAALKRPSALKTKIAKLLVLLQKGVDQLQAGGFASPAALSSTLGPAAKQAKALGLKVCGGG